MSISFGIKGNNIYIYLSRNFSSFIHNYFFKLEIIDQDKYLKKLNTLAHLFNLEKFLYSDARQFLYRLFPLKQFSSDV